MSELKKSLGVFDIIALAFGAMVGWGWVVLAGSWIISAGIWGGHQCLFNRWFGRCAHRCDLC